MLSSVQTSSLLLKNAFSGDTFSIIFSVVLKCVVCENIYQSNKNSWRDLCIKKKLFNLLVSS